MRFHPVIFLLLCWQCTGGKSVENISIESLLDEVAIPTKIISDFFQKPEKTSSKKLISNHRLESSTVHYQNSNGFVPLISKPYEKERKNNFTNLADKKVSETIIKRQEIAENTKIFSTEANKLLDLPDGSDNRRSYHMNGNQDDFEPLKVSNGTPIIANYDSYYDQSKEVTTKPDRSYTNGNLKKSFRNKDRERGKKIQTYLGNYDAMNEEDRYSYSDATVDQKKNFQYEKSNDNYKQSHTENYNQKTSLPRTNYLSLSTVKPNLRQISNMANNEQKFKNPIIIEPTEYKIDNRFSIQSVQSAVSTSNPQIDAKDQTDTHYSEYETNDQLSQKEGTNRNYDSADSRDFSEEYDDYIDEKEKSRRLQKTKRRPHQFDSSRKLPKEHREVYDNSYDDNGRKQTNLRSKSRYRPKTKPVRVVTEYNYNTDTDDSEEHSNAANNQQNEGTWNQVTPNLEVSHSNGYEVNQIEKPKLHIVPVNIVSNFDHATALDNSQGFDITNAMFTGFVDGSVVSTASPLISSTPNFINENVVASSTIKPKIEVSTSVPDVIVGQSSFNNPVHAVLMPNKLQQNLLNQYMQSTMAPAVFAVTPQSSFSASPTITPQLQQMLNQMQVFPFNQHLMTAQPTGQSHQSVQSNSNDNDDQSQNLYQSTSRSTTERTDSYYKKKLKENNGQYLASASMSVDHGSQRHSHNRNSKKKNNAHNDDSNYNSENNQQSKQNLNTYVQPTVVPAILHTGIGLLNNQNHQLIQNPLFIANTQQTSQLFKATNDAIENSIKQLQYNLLHNRNQLNSYAGLDNIGGASNNINSITNPVQKAQLPLLGAKNVEIINPNLNANAYAINQIPAAIVTTPIPIFTTTGFLTSKPALSTTTQEAPVSVSNFVNALTEIGTKKPDSRKLQNTNPFINLQGPDRPFFNPINFVPNYDLMKSQSILNNNVVSRGAFTHQNLNLVPVIPGGNFFKHSQVAQNDLANKPKLSSDLEKYAEEMFKESLRTIYNSHKWNNDPRPPSANNISLVDESDIAKLRNELLRIKNSLRESKIPKDVLEAHQTENKIRAVKPGHDHKRPDSSLEQSHKHKHHSHGPHHHHHSHHHHHRSKPHINDFLTPPKVNSFVSKSPFHDKPQKKRPPHGPRPNFNHENSRPRPRQGIIAKAKGSEAQASSAIDYRYPTQIYQDKYQYTQPEFRPLQNINYPTFTTSFPEIDHYKSSGEYKFSEKGYDVNHQRTHNLMGLLMKNNQLPPGVPSKQFNDKDTVNQIFEEENRRTQPQTYQDVIRSFQKKSDRQLQPIPLSRVANAAFPKISRKK